MYFLRFFSPSVHFHSENSRPAHGSRSPAATVNYNIISVTRILSVIDDRPRHRRNVIIINFFPNESASGRAFARITTEASAVFNAGTCIFSVFADTSGCLVSVPEIVRILDHGKIKFNGNRQHAAIKYTIFIAVVKN